MAKKDATQAGVSDEDSEEEIEEEVLEDSELEETPKNQRMESLSRIANSNREARDKNIAEEGREVPDTSIDQEASDEDAPDKSAAPEGSDDPDSDEDHDEDQEDDDDQEDQDEEMVKIKVDGVEQEVPKSKIYDAGVRAVQKESTADVRLEKATAILKEVQDRAAVGDQLDQGDDPDDKKESPLPDLDVGELAKAIQYGSEEEAAEALTKIVSIAGRKDTDATPKATPEQIAASVMENIAFNDALKEFEQEYPDIYNDEKLRTMASQRDTELVKDGDKRSYSERYKAIGQELTDWLKDKGVKDDADKGHIQDRKAKKKPSKHVTGQGTARTTTNPTPKRKTKAEIIREQAERRGQQI